MESSRCVAGPQPMKVTTGGAAGLSLFVVRLQLTESRSKRSNSGQKLRLLARACTMVAMASLRSTLERRHIVLQPGKAEVRWRRDWMLIHVMDQFDFGQGCFDWMTHAG